MVFVVQTMYIAQRKQLCSASINIEPTKFTTITHQKIDQLLYQMYVCNGGVLRRTTDMSNVVGSQ